MNAMSSDSTDKAGPRAGRNLPKLYMLAAIILVVAIAAGVGSLILANRAAEIDAWRGRIVVFTRLLAAHAEQVLAGARNFGLEVAADVKQDNVQDLRQLRQRFKSDAYRAYLVRRKIDWNDVFDVGVVDAQGKLFVASDLPIDREIDVSKRDYFLHCKKNADGGAVFVGESIRSISKGDWHFTLCSPILGADGEFIGAAITAVKSDYFRQYYAIDGALGRRFTVLMRDDGVVLAGDMFGSDYGQRVENTLMLTRPDDAARGLWTDHPGHAPGAMGTRLVGARKVPGFPVVFGSIVDGDVVLAGWKRSSLLLGGLAAVLCIAILAGAYWGGRAYTLRVNLWEARLRERDSAEIAQRTKLQFVSLVSHDLRTPLTTLMAGADLIQEGGTAGERKQQAGLIRTAASYVLSLVDSILNFSVSDTRVGGARAAAFDLRQTIEDCVQIARAGAQGRPLAFSSSYGADLPQRLVGDPGMIMQILMNLLGNAVKYTCRGTISVDASLLRRCEGKVWVQLAVRDTGPGIPEELRGRLFQPFVRGESQEVMSTEGHGLGLSIVSRLLAAQDGAIEVKSIAGEGATFLVSIPFAEAGEEPEARKAGKWAGEAGKNRLKILVAEDAHAIRCLLTSLLEKLGHEVVAVNDGVEALACAQASVFDFVLMDLRMPEMDGAEATRRIRALPAYCDTPIVALTGYSETIAADLFSPEGFTAHLQKPVSMGLLEEAIARFARIRAPAAAVH